MMRRFRDITDFNVYFDAQNKGGIYPLTMRETQNISDRDMAAMLELNYKMYMNLDQKMKTILKDGLVCRNASEARYKEVVRDLMWKQGIISKRAEVLDDSDLIAEVKLEITQYVELEDKKEERRVNKALSANWKQMLTIEEYRQSGLLSEEMMNRTALALYITTIIGEVDHKKLTVGRKETLPIVLEQKLSKYKSCRLADRVCKAHYKDLEEMHKHKIADLIAIFKKLVKRDRSVKGKPFDKRLNSHLCERLGMYTMIGFDCTGVCRPNIIVNGKKRRANVPEVKVTWKL